MRRSLAHLLAIGVNAAIAGARSFVAIGQWATDRPTDSAGGRRTGRAPDESALRRVFARSGGQNAPDLVAALDHATGTDRAGEGLHRWSP